MSFSSRVRYQSRQEKSKIYSRRIKAFVIIFLLGLVVYAFMHRVYIKDYISLLFY